MSDDPAVRLVRRIRARMRGKSGSVTLHFSPDKPDRVKVEYRDFETAEFGEEPIIGGRTAA